jgi:hypothetical protein
MSGWLSLSRDSPPQAMVCSFRAVENLSQETSPQVHAEVRWFVSTSTKGGLVIQMCHRSSAKVRAWIYWFILSLQYSDNDNDPMNWYLLLLVIIEHWIIIEGKCHFDFGSLSHSFASQTASSALSLLVLSPWTAISFKNPAILNIKSVLENIKEL